MTIGNFVNLNQLPDEVLDEIYPLRKRFDGTGVLEKWWDEMFRRCRSRNQNLKNN